jgi:hypothetical protein
VAAVVVLAHLGVYVLLVEARRPTGAVAEDESDAILIAIDVGLPPLLPTELHPEPDAVNLPPVALELPEFSGLSEPSGSADWRADGVQAAAEVGALDGASIRSFGSPERAPDKPRTKPFGWDRSHTHRVEVLPGQGIRFRLNDHCDLFVSFVPMAGCSLGRIPARGDLFDGMNAPVEMGDWKDSSTLTK